MGRKKGSKNKVHMENETISGSEGNEAEGVEIATTAGVKTSLTPVSVDFSSEGLNNLAMKINEIIEYLNK